MHRPTLGVLALVLLLAGAAGHLGWFADDAGQFSGPFLRVGTVLAVLWLALPQARQIRSKSLVAAAVILALTLVYATRFLPVVIGFAIVYFVLRPRAAKRSWQAEKPRLKERPERKT